MVGSKLLMNALKMPMFGLSFVKGGHYFHRTARFWPPASHVDRG